MKAGGVIGKPMITLVGESSPRVPDEAGGG